MSSTSFRQDFGRALSMDMTWDGSIMKTRFFAAWNFLGAFFVDQDPDFMGFWGRVPPQCHPLGRWHWGGGPPSPWRPQLHGEPAEAPAEVRGKEKIQWEFLVGKIWSILQISCWEELKKTTRTVFSKWFKMLEKKDDLSGWGRNKQQLGMWVWGSVPQFWCCNFQFSSLVDMKPIRVDG